MLLYMYMCLLTSIQDGVEKILGYFNSSVFNDSFNFASSLSLAILSCLNEPVKILSTFEGFLSTHSSMAATKSTGRTEQ